MIKTKNKVNNNVLLIVLSLLLFVGSIFAFVGFKIKNNNIVRADSVSTSFNGSSIFVPFTPEYYGYNYTWSFVSFNQNMTSGGYMVWSDGVDYYYSGNNAQYVLNVSTHTWSTMSWVGLYTFDGNKVWSDGVNYYYSSGSSQYVLDVSTHTWSTMTWNGLTNFNGQYIWFDGTSYYYSYQSNQYVLDVSTHTWSTMTWNGLTSFTGNYIWSDGVNYYYTSGYSRWVLSLSTHTWSTITFTGLTQINGDCVWFDGTSYYYSFGSKQYVLDVSTRTWSTMIWYGLQEFNGSNIFVIGNTSYIISNSSFLYRDRGSYQNRLGGSVFDSIALNFIDSGSGFTFSHRSVFFYPNDNSMNFVLSKKLVNNTESAIFSDTWTWNYNTNFSRVLYIPYYFNGTYYYAQMLVQTTGLSNLNFTRIDFSSAKFSDSTYNDILIYNTVTYTNSLDESIYITFMYYAYNTDQVYLFDGSSSDLYDALFVDYSNYIDNGYYFAFNNRTYYLIASDSAAYEQGYSSGFNAGQTSGYNSGYSAGSSATSQSQYNAGYSAGYSAGSVAGSNYSFLSLISAVIDAPIKAFTGLFNFDLLGVNILNFITALFTLAVIITIVKKVV